VILLPLTNSRLDTVSHVDALVKKSVVVTLFTITCEKFKVVDSVADKASTLNGIIVSLRHAVVSPVFWKIHNGSIVLAFVKVRLLLVIIPVI
jgi:hypothetical protein